MIEIAEARELVASHSRPLEPVRLPLDELCGHVLADDATSDVDSPPFDKAMMDGFALRAADANGGNATLRVAGRIMAGSTFEGRLPAGQAVGIMTGAPVPAGADAVVMIEQTTVLQDHVTVQAKVIKGQNIMTRATAMRSGEVVMPSGRRVRAEDIGLLAEAGVAEAAVIRRPTLAVIATGDELIEVARKPTGSQIRNSNGPMIAALARPLCREVSNLGIGPDQPDLLGARIREGLSHDVLVLSGGVSAGAADLVPGLLQQAGVRKVFHKVRIKPGKPVWFGVLPRDEGAATLVFGLPGNPVSSMVCFRVFVAPALRRRAGLDGAEQAMIGCLAVEHSQRPGRTTWWPCRLAGGTDETEVWPLDWKGSADLKTLAEADGFGIFPGEQANFAAGQRIGFVRMG
jgi:molybdopterin molybdotransferase